MDMTRSDKGRKYKVRFDRNASTTILIPSHREYTEEEIENSWYSKEEYKRIETQTTALLRMIKTGHFAEDHTKHCFRGIQSEEAKLKRASHRRQALHSLFWEQQRQYMAGCTDEEKIRKVLVMCTRHPTDEAILRAEFDRREALGLLTEFSGPKHDGIPELSKTSLLSSLVVVKTGTGNVSLRDSVCVRRELLSVVTDVLDLLDDPLVV